jgi:hypothetical protein
VSKPLFFRLYHGGEELKASRSEGIYFPIDPLAKELPQLPIELWPDSTQPASLRMRVILIPGSLSELNEHVIDKIFSIVVSEHTVGRERCKAAVLLNLTYRLWRRLVRRYSALPELLGISFVDLKRIVSIELEQRIIACSFGFTQEFKRDDWTRYGRIFFINFAQVSTLSQLDMISFDDCFTHFRPSEWSFYLGQCPNFRNITLLLVRQCDALAELEERPI